ncbi:quercetin 2,3-dioxygenase [mine drainage metagenome]|uniref:Quercetin 2,3-dioxygenase n=1 Tax=mine drainage metagenome TaxID=410659 RepID=A0A1J5S2I9_9ZZZZ
MSITVRPSSARGHAHHGWLDTWHTFSFAHYFDPRHMGFRSLRVINEDVVAPKTGFPQHGHRDMEILTYIIEGRLEHRDSSGGHSVIGPGEVQRMTAGSGIRHSEMNPSSDQAVKLLQIWLLPEREGLEPGYEQTLFPESAKRNRLCLIAAPAGAGDAEGALTLRQNARVYASRLTAGHSLDYAPAHGRGLWLQMVSGGLEVNGVALTAGDGAAVEGESAVSLAASGEAEFLLFDLG